MALSIAPGYFCPEDDQPMAWSEPQDAAATLQCILCRRVYSVIRPKTDEKPTRGAFTK